MQQQYPPQFQQQQQQPQGQILTQEEAEIFAELMRAVVHEIASHMDDDVLDAFSSHQTHGEFINALRAHNGANEAKIRNRKRQSKSAGTPRRRQDGSIDKFNANDASARTRAIFEAALGRKGR